MVRHSVRRPSRVLQVHHRSLLFLLRVAILDADPANDVERRLRLEDGIDEDVTEQVLARVFFGPIGVVVVASRRRTRIVRLVEVGFQKCRHI